MTRTRGQFEARGMGPFRTDGETGDVMQYYEVPGDVLEDPQALQRWVEASLAVARRAKGGRSRGRGA